MWPRLLCPARLNPARHPEVRFVLQLREAGRPGCPGARVNLNHLLWADLERRLEEVPVRHDRSSRELSNPKAAASPFSFLESRFTSDERPKGRCLACRPRRPARLPDTFLGAQAHHSRGSARVALECLRRCPVGLVDPALVGGQWAREGRVQRRHAEGISRLRPRESYCSVSAKLKSLKLSTQRFLPPMAPL